MVGGPKKTERWVIWQAQAVLNTELIRVFDSTEMFGE
jgi:hypothetical protein